MNARALGRATLARQLLLERASLDVVEAVGRLGALQAQEARPPFVALWSRLGDFPAGELIDALAAKTLVRGTLMRGTVHLARAKDFLRWQPLLAPLGVEGLRKVVGARLDGADVDAAVEDVRALFASADELSADEVRDWIAEHRPGEDTRAVARIALYSLPLVRVPDGGRWGFTPKSRFTDSRHWLGREPRADAAALIRSYLAAFGPATVRDAQQFLGGGDWQDVFDELELERFGKHYDLPAAPRPGEDAEAPVRFLPDFDSLMLAHADRSRVIADEHRKALTTKNLRVRAVVLVDGMVAGFWKLERKRVVVEPVRKLLKREQAAVDAEAERLAAFAG
ncbi:winged helix DNA-binding domain-containing protein [Candidatus Solirubrobacter pratensis]|uniref:winged helix DNA-binding domain-containing protein n=1 Tax=Candidatus Solirubrobacter pratensis TaxID=1298857 RepID=UPI00040DC8A6|nr:winged helix DNA-binding domain-containing protein [Candidatus Solirubrobacter pratensis]